MTSILDIKQKSYHFMTSILDVNIERIKETLLNMTVRIFNLAVGKLVSS